jgi:putative OPT family oligopeptide transporter
MSDKEIPFKPYVSAETKLPEFTLKALVLGVLLGILFGVGNAYLALKLGTTVSASIPAAVLSMAILRLLFKRVSILENNLVQTIATVGEALAAGIVFTVPALFLLGERPPPLQIFLLSALGGILGVLFMIPMRRYLIVHEHKKLPYPEGTACAEILKSGEAGRHKALMAGVGILSGFIYKICNDALFLWNEIVSWKMKFLRNTEFSMDCTPSLLGVGFIIGPRIASFLFAGGIIGWWVIIPLMSMFGEGSAIIYPGTIPISQMSAEDVWSNYVRYIGAGTVAIGGLVSLFKIWPLINKILKTGFRELIQFSSNNVNVLRTDKDISMRWLIIGSLAIILFLWLFPLFKMNLLTIVILAILGFFFVAVTSLTVGIVGSTSSPVSGMTICVLLIVCLIFVGLGWTQRIYLLSAITMAIVANIAICLGATTSQDLKAGFLLGATPRLQQIGEIIGVLLPSIAITATIYLLDKTYGFGSTMLPAPQATMTELIAKGVMNQNIPVTLVIVGVVIGLIVEVFRVPILPFAIGLYLPLSLSTSIMVGGVVSLFIKKVSTKPSVMEAGILTSSGLVAGDAFMGVIIALFTVLGWIPASGKGLLPDIASLIIFLALGAGLAWYALKHPTKK